MKGPKTECNVSCTRPVISRKKNKAEQITKTATCHVLGDLLGNGGGWPYRLGTGHVKANGIKLIKIIPKTENFSKVVRYMPKKATPTRAHQIMNRLINDCVVGIGERLSMELRPRGKVLRAIFLSRNACL
jgi:hypothetical protein